MYSVATSQDEPDEESRYDHLDHPDVDVDVYTTDNDD